METKTQVFRVDVTRRIIRKATLLVVAESAKQAKILAEGYSDQWLGDDEMTLGNATDKLSNPVLAKKSLMFDVEMKTGCGISEVTVVPT